MRRRRNAATYSLETCDSKTLLPQVGNPPEVVSIEVVLYLNFSPGLAVRSQANSDRLMRESVRSRKKKPKRRRLFSGTNGASTSAVIIGFEKSSCLPCLLNRCGEVGGGSMVFRRRAEITPIVKERAGSGGVAGKRYDGLVQTKRLSRQQLTLSVRNEFLQLLLYVALLYVL